MKMKNLKTALPLKTMSDNNEEEVKKENSGTLTPYIEPIPFDYDKYQDEHTIKATIEILKCIGKNAELLAYTHDTESNVIVENMSKVAQEIMNIIIDCKVPNSDMQKLADLLSQTPYQLFTIIQRQNSEFEKELLARFIGVRDPGTKKYSREFSSMGDMFEALIKLREIQGNNVEDYYNIEKKDKK